MPLLQSIGDGNTNDNGVGDTKANTNANATRSSDNCLFVRNLEFGDNSRSARMVQQTRRSTFEYYNIDQFGPQVLSFYYK